MQIAVVYVSEQTSAVYIFLKDENEMSKLDSCGLRGIYNYTHKNLTTCQQDVFATGLYSKLVNKL
jgi:hypothetical protein